MLKGVSPPETYPRIGTIEGPATFRAGEDDLLLSYEIAPVDGGGCFIFSFKDVVHFEQNPINVEGLHEARFPVNAWDITEVLGSERTRRWSNQFRSRRFWTISFMDYLVEIVFSDVRKVYETKGPVAPGVALLTYLNSSR